MSENRARFNSSNGKRLVLVVDDVAVNREMLGAILEGDYEVIFAEDGQEALEQVARNRDMLSLIVLDLLMPRMSGRQALERLKADPETADIPIIVASADSAQEIECLDIGASDFIQKPYPDAGVILARIRRTIELSEDRQIIQSTERDPLTGLYNKEYFYNYAAQYDQHHKAIDMDALVLDINNFSILNERYGREYADDVLRRVGEKTREMVHDSGGIVCRRGADTFLIYCPHRDDYKAILDNASAEFANEQKSNHRVRLRMGVYSNVDKSLDIERRFDRAKMAADTVRNSYLRNIGVYDDSLHKSELYAERLVEDFSTAIQEGQFKVYYQPKFAIQSEAPILESAEALVRWQHPELGLVNPGVFIPLYEENGLIQTLDNYVWCEVARQIAVWNEKFGYCMPISVNVSRVDMYDPNIVHTLLSLLEENSIEESDLHLEVTESAYAEEPDQIVETVNRLRGIGFSIEMDDFGTGYSSLNMLSTLPIDALKLDMGLVHTAFAGEKDTHLLEVIMEIAEHLGVPVIAEGVETEDQLSSLQEMGCDVVQGYYFSAPVPPEEFEHFLEESDAVRIAQARRARMRANDKAGSARGEASAHGGKRVADDAPLDFWGSLPNVRLRTASLVFVVVAFVTAAALFVSDGLVMRGYQDMERANERYIRAQQAATNLEVGSDRLTYCVRSFVMTGDIAHLEDFFEEAEVTRQRDNAVSSLEELLQGVDSPAYRHLAEALSLSNELMGYEYHAMKLVVSAGDYDESNIPAAVRDVQLAPEEQALSPGEKRSLAQELVFGTGYSEYKKSIAEHATQSTESLIADFEEQRQRAMGNMDGLIVLQTVLTGLFFLVVLATALFIALWVRRPLMHMVALMKEKQTVPPMGARELRFVSDTYNTIFEENRRIHARLTYGSTHDALTGLFNRKAYDIMREDMDMSRTALLLIDVDKFKSINDTHGHDVGDLLLKRVAEVLRYSFRSTDLVFRLGGDEFVVIMADVDSSVRDQVKDKIDQANVMLQKPNDDLPPTSLSVGVAFADRQNPDGDIFKDADTALYRVKEAGRCGCIIY